MPRHGIAAYSVSVILNLLYFTKNLICFVLYGQNAVENDELDVKSDQMEVNYENVINAYCSPCLRPVNFLESDSSSTQPLVSSL